MIRIAWTPLALALCSLSLHSQGSAIPSQFSGLPGNAAIAMPVRWSQGVMQVIWDRAMIADVLQGQTIRRIQLRRPAFPNEPDYPALQRTIKLSMGMTTRAAAEMTSDLAANRPESLSVVAGPTTLAFPALPAHGAGDAVASLFVDLVLDQPFAVTGTENLFLEWENLDSVLSMGEHHWIEAVQLPPVGGIALQVGNGGCGSAAIPRPMVLSWVAGAPPASGALTRLHLDGAPPGSAALVVLGLDPQEKQPPWNLGFGGDLVGLLPAPGCYLWTGLDLGLPQVVDPGGTMAIDLPFPVDVDLSGQRIGVQVVAVDPEANPAGLAFSNGVLLIMDTLGFSPGCSTVLLPGTGDQSPYPPFRGVAPVVLFGF